MAVSQVSFSKTPQAKDDRYADRLTEDSLQAVFDVMGNDLGGAAKKLYALDDGDNDRDLLGRDLGRSAAASRDFSAKGARIWITDDGKVGYDAGALGPRLQSLALGQTFEDSFTYAIQLGNGTLSVARVTVVIAGTNDGPVITSAAQAGDVQEDVVESVSGQVTATDVDDGDRLHYSLPDGGAGTYGALSLDADTGAWTYRLHNGAGHVQALAQGEQHVESFTIRVSDNFGASATQLVRVTITGTNDGPRITSPDQVGATIEDVSAMATGRVTASDVDNGDRLGFAVAGSGAGRFGSFVVHSVTGEWTYELDDASPLVQALAQGEAPVERFTVRVSDAFGAWADQAVDVTVSGSNDAPVITSAAQAGGVREDLVGSVSGQVTARDVDNGDRQHYALPDGGTGAYGALTLEAATGAWTYQLHNGAAHVQALAQGEQHVESFTVLVSDDFGASASQGVSITVTGTNDGPQITSPGQAGLTIEDVAALAAGQVTATDVDNGDRLGFAALGAAAGSFGWFAVNADTGDWTYSLDESSLHVQALAQDETHVETFTVRVTDAWGAWADQAVNVTVTGTNDAPVLAAALASSTNEDEAAYGIDLLAGATDVDRGAVLHVTGVAEASGKGGWVLAGDLITIDPDFFGEHLHDGDFEHLLFTYQVVDEHGASVAQTLAVSIEGITDAPSLEVVTSAGARVNEVMLTITSQPARHERVALTFGQVAEGARIFDAVTGQDVTQGLPDYLGTRQFKLVLRLDADEYDDLSIAATGYRPDGSAIAATVRSVDLAYDVAETSETLNFSSDNQNIWGDFPGYIEFHEYIPFVGGTPVAWDAGTASWVDVPSAPWRSGEFSLVDVQLDTGKIVAVAQQQAKGTLDAAKAVFDATAYVIDAGVQAAFDTARQIFEAAEYTYYHVARGVDKAVQDAFNLARDIYEDAREIYDAASDVFHDVATAAYDWARDEWENYKSWYDSLPQSGIPSKDAEQINIIWGYWPRLGLWEVAQLVYQEATDLWNEARHAFEVVAQGAYDAAWKIYQDAKAAVDNAALAVFDKAREAFDFAKDVYEDAKAAVLNAAQAAYDGVVQGVNDTLAAIGSKIDFNSRLTVQADVFAQAGLQVDAVLDLGSVDTSIEYQLTSTTRYNQTTDVLLITPVVANRTTDGEVAFQTVSPNAKFHIVLHYDAGADFDVLLDGHLRVEGATLYDLTPGSTAPLDLGATVSPKTAVADIQGLLAELGGLDVGGDLDVGKLVLVDFDSSELEPFKVPFVGKLTKDVVNITLQFPNVATQGTQADYSPGFYQEGGLVAVDFSEISGAIFNLVNARLDYSPELRAKIPGLGSLQEVGNFDQLVESALQAFMGTLLDVLDGSSKEVPIFLVDATDQTATSLLHLNLWPDSATTSTLDGSTASLGFHVSYGESAPVIQISFDVDQAIALVVNEIVKAAVKVATQGSATAVLQALPTINPLDIKIGLATVLEALQMDAAAAETIGKFLDLNLRFQAADVDAHATAKFSQEFALSIDDMSYRVTLEDGTVHAFTANGAGELQIRDASRHDRNGDGRIDYTMDVVPTAMFSNDTELGFGAGYTLDFMKGSLAAGIKIPVGELLGINASWLNVKIPLVNVAVGPLLRVQGDLDVLDVDLFEARFGLDVGSDRLDSTVDLALVGFNQPLVDG
ncbi:MAG TPA: VCBS domain-containing protein [Ramlibacter sp.]|nr:VCBS domain-containing protein [Ramlibacter sp.]